MEIEAAKPGQAGTRIRDRRIDAGLRQSALAKRVGISASYLNLIEHNKRRIGGALLHRIADELRIDARFLSDGSSHRLLDTLHAVATRDDTGQLDPAAEAVAPEINRAQDFVSRFPGWASRLAALSEATKRQSALIEGLNDRLSHDPVLSDKMHEVLGVVAAIRSTASILVGDRALDPEWQRRFHGNIDRDSRRLSEAVGGMARHFEALSQRDGSGATLFEYALSVLDTARYRFDAIEKAGASAIGEVITELGDLPEQTRTVLRAELARYAREAAALPRADFHAAALATDYAPDMLAERFAEDLPVIFRRLASLPVAPDTPDFGLISCDASGAVTFRKSPGALSLPRFGTGCPLWPLYAALQQPDQPLVETFQTPAGDRFRAYAACEQVRAADFGARAINRGWMLLRALPTDATEEPVPPLRGVSCRICPHPACPARREPSLLDGG